MAAREHRVLRRVLLGALVIDHFAWESTGGDACMAALKRDARRLAALTGSP